MASADEESVLNALAARIAAGETIRTDELPEALAATPAVQRLLRFARVAQVLVDNVHAPPAEAPPPPRIGPWRLLHQLGAGGMGDVWLGERSDGTVEHRVAIKRVRGASIAFTQRLEVERRILAKLSHPNIARFIDAGVDASGAPWLALEYVEGVALTDWLDRERPSLQTRLGLFLSICAAVEHAHRHLIVHRDIKPANVLVDAQGVPHLLDFGIAKLLDGSSSELTAAGLTPAYASPEQLRGGEISTATDVYALGLLLFRMLAGELPETRRDASLAVVLSRIDQEETQRPSRQDNAARQLPYTLHLLRGDLDAIVSKAIRARPEQRYATVRDLAADVQRHLEGRPVEARPPTRWYLWSRFARRHRGALSVAMAASVGVLLSLGLALWQAHRADAAAREAMAEAQRADGEAASARAQAQRAERAQRFLVELFVSANPEANQGRMPTARDLIERGAERLQSSALAPDDRQELALTIAESWVGIGDVEAAGKLLAELPGDAAAPSPRAANLRGKLAIHAGDLAVAQAAFQAALDGVRGDSETAVIERNEARAGLAQLALFQGDSRLAQTLLTPVLEELRLRLGEGHLRTLEAQTALGVLHISLAELDSAVQQLQTAADLAVKHQGERSALVCRVRASLSDALERQGDASGALKQAEAAIASCQAVYGSAHRRYGQAELAAGFALGKLGRSTLALQHYERARQAFRAAGHFDEGSALRYAGGILLGLERHAEALSTLQQAEELLAARMGEDAELVLASRINRATALRALGRRAEAQALGLAAWQKLETKPEENSTRLNALRLLGLLAQDRADYAAALRHFEQLQTVQARIHGPASRAVALVLQLKAQCLTQRGEREDLAQARAALDQAVTIQQDSEAPALEQLGVRLDRMQLLQAIDRAAAKADLAAARTLAAQLPEIPPSLKKRLAAPAD